LLFLALWLFRVDLLTPPRFVEPWKVALSIVPLLAGFAASVTAYRTVMQQYGVRVGIRRMLAASGLYTLAKYVPGKMWSHVGMAGYLADRCDRTVFQLSALSLHGQVISLWTGLALGLGALAFTGASQALAWSLAVAFCLATIFLMTPAFHDLTNRIVGAVFRRTVLVPRLSAASTMRAAPMFVLAWLAWGTGFYLLANGLSESFVSPKAVVSYALAAVGGMLSPVTPGGLGVREGIMTWCLTDAGARLQEAVTIAACARLWSLVGELVFFAAGTVAHRAGPSGT
jgi:uncharacterized membrane protein YbhN (UPF0104 family)